MLAPYRLAYLAIAVALMGGFAWVSAEIGSDDGSSLSLRIQTFNSPANAEVFSVTGGPEKGNLTEVGAKELFSVSDFLRAGEISRSKPVLIFKHSTDCSISGAAYRRLADWIEAKGDDAPPVFVVKVIERRPVSQEIASRTAVRHESPQAILLDRARAVWDASHDAITAEALDTAFANSAPKHEETD